MRSILGLSVAATLALPCCPTVLASPASQPWAGLVSSPAPTPSLALELPKASHVLLEARLNGKGPYWLILDTGSQATTLDAAVADEIGLARKAGGQIQGAGEGAAAFEFAAPFEIDLGPGQPDTGPQDSWSFDEHHGIVLPLAGTLGEIGGRPIAGILGGSTLDRFAITIDRHASLLTLHTPGAFEPPTRSTILDMPSHQGFPYFDGVVVPAADRAEPIEGAFLLDLGANHGVMLTHAAGAELVDAEHGGERIEGQAIGGGFAFTTAPAASITIAGHPLDMARLGHAVEVPLAPGGGPPIPDLIGFVGLNALSEHTLTLDYANGRLVLHPKPQPQPQPQPPTPQER